MSPLARKDLDTLLSTLNNPSTPKLQHQWQDNTYRMLLLSHPLWPTRKKTPSRVIHTFKAFPNALIYWLNPQTLSAPFRWNTHVTNLVKYLLHAPLTLCHNPLNSPPGSTRLSVYLPGIFPGGSKSSFCAFGTFFCRRKSSIELLFFLFTLCMSWNYVPKMLHEIPAKLPQGFSHSQHHPYISSCCEFGWFYGKVCKYLLPMSQMQEISIKTCLERLWASLGSKDQKFAQETEWKLTLEGGHL